MGGIVKSILPILADVAAVATGNPELIPIIHGGSTLAQGGSFGDAAKSAGLAYAGQEFLPAFGNAFPETAGSLGISGGANSLTDLLGQTTGGASLMGPGTIGGDISSLASRASGGLGSLLSGGGASTAYSGLANPAAAIGGFKASSPLTISSPASSGFGVGSGLTSEFAKGIAGNSPAFSSLASPSLNAGFGAAPSSYGGLGSLLGGGSSYGNLGALATLGGGANSYFAGERAKKDLINSQNTAMGILQPYLNSGQGANAKLSDLLGTSGNSSASGYGSLDQPFNPGDLTKDPGYQFNLAQGTKALDRKAAASGNYFSGEALKATEDYGQGLADNTYNSAFNRNQQQKQQQYGMLAGQAGNGASGSTANIATEVGNAKANAGISASNILNNSLSSLLSGSGLRKLLGYTQSGQPIYA